MTVSKTNFILGAAIAATIGFIFGIVASKGYYENLAEEIINDEVEAQVKRLRRMDEEKAEVANDRVVEVEFKNVATPDTDETPVMFFISKEQFEGDDEYEKIDLYFDEETGFVKDIDGVECDEYTYVLGFATGGLDKDGGYVRNEYTLVDYHLKRLEVEEGEK